MKAFIDDVIFSRTHGTTVDLLTGALQMGCDENKASKIPQFINY